MHQFFRDENRIDQVTIEKSHPNFLVIIFGAKVSLIQQLVY